MGLLAGFLGGSKKKRRNTTRQRRTPDELNALRRHRFLNRLQQDDPGLYRELMLDELNGGRRRKEKEVDPIEQVVSTLHTLRAEGLIDDPRKAGAEDHWWQQALESLSPGLGAALVAKFGPLLMGGAPAAQQQPVTVAEPRYQEPAQLEEPQTQHIGSAPMEEAPMTFLAGIIIHQLADLEPEAAAQWIVEQPQAQGFVQLILSTADDDIPAALAELAGQGPDFAAIVGWLRGRPEWFMQTARAVRALKGEQPQSQKKKEKNRMGF